MLKIFIVEDERFPDYILRKEDSGVGFSGPYDISDEKLLWVEKTICEYEKVQDFLEKIVNKPLSKEEQKERDKLRGLSEQTEELLNEI